MYFLLSHINVNSHRRPKAAALVRKHSTVQKGSFAHQSTTEGCLSPSSLLLLYSVLEQTANCTGLFVFFTSVSLNNNLDINLKDKKKRLLCSQRNLNLCLSFSLSFTGSYYKISNLTIRSVFWTDIQTRKS